MFATKKPVRSNGRFIITQQIAIIGNQVFDLKKRSAMNREDRISKLMEKDNVQRDNRKN